MKRFFLTSLVLGLTSGLVLGVCAIALPAEKTTELTVTYHFPIGSIQDRHIQRWAKKVEEDSNGRLKFKIFGGGVLVGAFDTYHSIPKGVADIGAGYRYGKGAPFTDELFSMALMGTPNVAASTRVVDDFRREFPEHYTKEWGDTKILWLQADPGSIIITRRPIRTPEDANGVEVRAPIKPMAEAWKAMGAKPTSMTLADFVIGLQRGTVDGGTTTIIDIRAFKFTASVKYCTEFGIVACPSWYFVMNADKWKSLPPDLQKIIDNNCEWGKHELVKMLDDETEAARKWATTEGMEFIVLNKEQKNKFVTLLEPVYLKLAAELDAKGYPATRGFRFARERLSYHSK
jgi:TRAP-type transport system periplasmic protein